MYKWIFRAFLVSSLLFSPYTFAESPAANPTATPNASKEDQHPQNDFTPPVTEWRTVHSKDRTGEHQLLTIKDSMKEQIYMYWMGPGTESTIQTHDEWEEVMIVKGSLFWLNKDKSIQKKLEVGAYVDRKPFTKHGPFKAGPEGCLMYVRFHS